MSQPLHQSIPCHYCGRETVGFDRQPIAQGGKAGLRVFLRCASCGWCFRVDLTPIAGKMVLVSKANVRAPEGLSQLEDRPLGIVRAPDPAVDEPVELFPTLMTERYAGVPGLDEAEEDSDAEDEHSRPSLGSP